MHVTIGTDPEVCVVDQTGAIVPSGWCFDRWADQGMTIIMPPPPEPDMPPKGRKLALTGNAMGGYLYEDGASLEFNVPSTYSHEHMVEILHYTLQRADELVDQAGYTMAINASLPITAETIARGGVALSRFGCDPDTTLWDDPYDPGKIDASACYRRYYGGHIHVGVPDGLDEEYYYDVAWEMSLTCDLLLGLTDVIIDHTEDARLRRQVYGRIGRHRMQRYQPGIRGYEYRVPSNGWLRHPRTAHLMFKLAQLASYVTTQPYFYDRLTESLDLDNVKTAINTTDPDLASNILMGRVVPLITEWSQSNPFMASLDITMGLAFVDFGIDWRTAWFS